MSVALYQLYDNRLKTLIAQPTYNTLRAARVARRSFNRAENDPLRYIVVPGPAHPHKVKAKRDAEASFIAMVADLQQKLG